MNGTVAPRANVDRKVTVFGATPIIQCSETDSGGMFMEMAPNVADQLADLTGKKHFGTAVGTVTVRREDDGFRVNAHEILQEGHRNTSFLVDRNGKVQSSVTVVSCDTEEVGEVSYGALSVGYVEPQSSPAIYTLRDVLQAVRALNNT